MADRDPFSIVAGDLHISAVDDIGTDIAWLHDADLAHVHRFREREGDVLTSDLIAVRPELGGRVAIDHVAQRIIRICRLGRRDLRRVAIRLHQRGLGILDISERLRLLLSAAVSIQDLLGIGYRALICAVTR